MKQGESGLEKSPKSKNDILGHDQRLGPISGQKRENANVAIACFNKVSRRRLGEVAILIDPHAHKKDVFLEANAGVHGSTPCCRN